MTPLRGLTPLTGRRPDDRARQGNITLPDRERVARDADGQVLLTDAQRRETARQIVEAARKRDGLVADDEGDIDPAAQEILRCGRLRRGEESSIG